MNKDYFSRLKTGGSNLSSGIAYQDNISLFYLFENINNPQFKAITFETNDDFTIIYDSYELCIQVKKTPFSCSQVNAILANGYSCKNDKKRYRLVSSSVDEKFQSILNKRKQLENAEKFSKKEEFLQIKNEFRQIIRKVGIDYDKFIKVEFDIIPLEYIDEVIKFKIYRWSVKNNISIEVDDLFEKLIAKISTSLRINRGSLNYDYIEYIARKCLKRTYKLIKKPPYYDSSIESITVALDRDIEQFKHLSGQLMGIKFYIKDQKYQEALKLLEEIYDYNENFMYYYIWILYKVGEKEKVINLCDDLIGKNKCIYYANYYKGVILLEKNDYEQALKCLKLAKSIQDTYDINFQLGNLYKSLDETDNSLRYYKRCFEIDNTDANLYLEISSLLTSAKAIEYIDNALKINPKLYKAYYKKGQILHFYGIHNEAYKCFLKYLEYNKDDIECFREISLCLLSMNDNKAEYYLNYWLKEILFDEKYNQIKSGKQKLFIDLMWNETQVILCTKCDEGFVVNTSLSQYLIQECSYSQIAIGCIVDSFLEMNKKMFQRRGENIDDGFEFIPCIIKRYSSDIEFQSVLNQIKMGNNLLLNKEDNIELSDNSICKFKEYISEEGKVNVLIDEFLNSMHVRASFENHIISGWFKKDGEGYFAFCNKMQSEVPFNEAVFILTCDESKEQVNIKFNVKGIKFNKNPIYYSEDDYIEKIKMITQK